VYVFRNDAVMLYLHTYQCHADAVFAPVSAMHWRCDSVFRNVIFELFVYHKVRHIEFVCTYIKRCHIVGTSSVWSTILYRLICGNNRLELIFPSKRGILYRKSRKINLDLFLGFKDGTAVFSAEKPPISTTEERQSSQVVRLERGCYICIVKVK
jgi:hypothetical protein